MSFINIFKNAKHAQFMAAAASVASIPPLQGLPEVSILQSNGCESTEKKQVIVTGQGTNTIRLLVKS
jgi:hypothetical protein